MWGLSLEGRANAGQILCINSYLKSDDWLRSSTSSRSLRIRMHHVVWVLEIITPSWLSEVVPSHFAFSFAFMCILWHCMQVPTSRQLPKENLQPVCVMRELSPCAICHFAVWVVEAGWWRYKGTYARNPRGHRTYGWEMLLYPLVK